MEAAANALLGFFIIACIGFAMSGISLWVQVLVWLSTLAYLIYWTTESMK